MKFTLEIDCDNAAFGEHLSERHEEVLWILKGLLSGEIGFESGDTGLVLDSNGNRVGKWEFSQ